MHYQHGGVFDIFVIMNKRRFVGSRPKVTKYMYLLIYRIELTYVHTL